uniref:Biogenesis of lysosome-related organelles complex 1 subunit 4 n=1 Tax=Moschus moschiferus TaxID=68415 RepID=A0A8C6DHR3_MOSMO
MEGLPLGCGPVGEEPRPSWRPGAGTAAMCRRATAAPRGRGRRRARRRARQAGTRSCCAAAGYASRLLPEIEALDASLEDLLTRVDEFVGMLDMLRSDSSHVVGEGVRLIYAKATEMRRVYSKIDRLEAFVGMVSASVARLEEQVARAEAELGAFPSTFRKLLHTINVPSFFHKAPSGRPQLTRYEPPPVVFRTEDHFPCCSERPQV